MNSQRPIKWAACHFTEEEWHLVQATWQRLVEEEKLVFGHKPPVRGNMERLVEELKKSDQDFRKNHRTGFPAGSKKYRRLYNFVDRQSKKESGHASESSVLSIRSAREPNHETTSLYFGDAPPISQSQLVASSFQDAEAKTQDLTKEISDLNLTPSPDKKEHSSLEQPNPFMKMISFEEESHSNMQGPVPIFAQISQANREPPVRPEMSNEFFSQLTDVQAAHQLCQSFQREVNKPELIALYTKAYKWHAQEAARYKSLLDQIGRSLTHDLDQQMQPLPWGVNESMKQLLDKKKDEL